MRTGTTSSPLLLVEGLNAYYGSARVLQNISFELGEQAVAVVGRNRMGKTTMCAAIMGISPPRASGSVKFRGTELIGRSSHKIARLGIGYVPGGRRLFPSLSVDEHLRIAASSRNGDRRWTPDAVYELFPRLAERKRNGGPAVGRRAADARDRARAGHEPDAVIMASPPRGFADDHRAADLDLPSSRKRGFGSC